MSTPQAEFAEPGTLPGALLRLTPPAWQERQAAHHARVDAWLGPRRQRRLRGEHHPVEDFLFDYYPYSMGRLRAWHPGPGVLLVDGASTFAGQTGYVVIGDAVILDALPAARVPRLQLARRILEGTLRRPAQHSCFGMHEWAMVDGLRQEEIRHERVPLRLSPEAITAAVDEVGLRCTHIDAYRFFTPASVPKNALEPSRARQPELEQAGCIHANMDLYKYAMWASPWFASELVADCFALALAARDLDMQASPYDVSSFGLTPIAVETAEGRAEYARRQRAITADATPLRERLAAALRMALAPPLPWP